MKIEYGNPVKTIIFPTPPDQNELEGTTPKEMVVESVTGERQVVQYSRIRTINQKFTMLDRSFVTGELKDFFLNHALFGHPFKYFFDAESSEFGTYHLDERVFRPTKSEATFDRYDVEFTLRRVS